MVSQYRDESHALREPVVDVLAGLAQSRVVEQGRTSNVGKGFAGVGTVQENLNAIRLRQAALLDAGDSQDLGEGFRGLHSTHSSQG